MRILKMASETNYRIVPNEAERLVTLLRNTGRDWTKAESLAGLWAYCETKGSVVSRVSGSPISEVALRIGRAVGGVYNKVMNFRSIDPTDERAGLSALANIDQVVWDEYFDKDSGRLRHNDISAEYLRLWGGGGTTAPQTAGSPC